MFRTLLLESPTRNVSTELGCVKSLITCAVVPTTTTLKNEKIELKHIKLTPYLNYKERLQLMY